MRFIKISIIFLMSFYYCAFSQSYSTLNVYSENKDTVSYQIIFDNTRIVSLENGERVSIKIINPRSLQVKIRNRITGYTYNTNFDFKNNSYYFWEFGKLTRFSEKERDEAIVIMSNEEMFGSEKIKCIEIDCEEEVRITAEKEITIDLIDFGNDSESIATEDDIPVRPAPVGAKEIDDFVNKAFDIFETTVAFSDQIRNINSKIQELMQLQNVVNNPIKEVKKEAMLMQRHVQILIDDSQQLIKIAPNVMNGAKKLKFTKIAAATKNLSSSIDAVKWSMVTLGELLNDLPGILADIGNFEKKYDIQDTEIILPDVSEEGTILESGRVDTPGLTVINDSEIKAQKPVIGQLLFTRDTKRLLIYDGEEIKEVQLKDIE